MKIERGLRKEREGRVVSTRMQKTVRVVVERLMKHSLYGKVVRRSKVLMAHNEKGDCREGDWVRLAENRPLSRRKQWRVVKILGRDPVK
jgi:small subunit ribosomal protein S17